MDQYIDKVIMFPYDKGAYPGAVRVVIVTSSANKGVFTGYDLTRQAYRTFKVINMGSIRTLTHTIIDTQLLPSNTNIAHFAEGYRKDGQMATELNRCIYIL